MLPHSLFWKGGNAFELLRQCQCVFFMTVWSKMSVWCYTVQIKHEHVLPMNMNKMPYKQCTKEIQLPLEFIKKYERNNVHGTLCMGHGAWYMVHGTWCSNKHFCVIMMNIIKQLLEKHFPKFVSWSKYWSESHSTFCLSWDLWLIQTSKHVTIVIILLYEMNLRLLITLHYLVFAIWLLNNWCFPFLSTCVTNWWNSFVPFLNLNLLLHLCHNNEQQYFCIKSCLY